MKYEDRQEKVSFSIEQSFYISFIRQPWLLEIIQ